MSSYYAYIWCIFRLNGVVQVKYIGDHSNTLSGYKGNKLEKSTLGFQSLDDSINHIFDMESSKNPQKVSIHWETKV